MNNRRILLWILGILAAIGGLIGLAVLTNPSYDRHLDKTAQTMRDRQAAHVAVCPKCAKVESFDYWAMTVMQVHVRRGFDYKNDGVFSVVSPGDLGQAQTIGFCGRVIGPYPASEYVCPADVPIKAEMPRLPDMLSRQVVFHVSDDGTLRYEGSVVSEEQAVPLVAGLEHKEETAIIFRAASHCRIAKITEIIDLLTGKQRFGAISMTPDDDGDAKE